ncbi:hypothetical protein D3C75_1235740 [compost metagenome]
MPVTRLIISKEASRVSRGLFLYTVCRLFRKEIRSVEGTTLSRESIPVRNMDSAAMAATIAAEYR